MRLQYQKWMHDWETRLNQRDTNRVVRPFEWGLEWALNWPLVNGAAPRGRIESFVQELNHRIVAHSGQFFSYRRCEDFRLQHEVLRFTSPITTRYAENNTAVARWFPARGSRAVVVLPQWNADGASHISLCRIFQVMGIAALRLSLPYHDVRKPPETERADYAVSANICRTIDAARQAVIDTRCCLDWLEARGYTRLGIVGTSLGSCYAFITAAHDPRLKVSVFNHASTYFADVVWNGQSTHHVRVGLEDEIDLERLRRAWLAISPMAYIEKFAAKRNKSLIVYATYDLSFPPELSRELVSQMERRKLDHDVAVLPCGHYSSGETPFKYLDAWHVARFLDGAF